MTVGPRVPVDHAWYDGLTVWSQAFHLDLGPFGLRCDVFRGCSILLPCIFPMPKRFVALLFRFHLVVQSR